MATPGCKHLRASLLGLTLAGLALAGCGGSNYANKPRPPSPINLSAYMSDTRVSLAPASFGAGPIVITVANQSGKPRKLTLSTDQFSSSTMRAQSSDVVTPSGTGELKLSIQPGDYQLTASGGGIAPASVHVGSQRTGSQNQLLQP